MTTGEEVQRNSTRRNDCRACCHSLTLTFEEVLHTFEFSGVTWTVDKAVCSECGHVDVSARHTNEDGASVICGLSYPSVECDNCDTSAIATVIDLPAAEDSQRGVEHFCEEHAPKKVEIVHYNLRRLSREAVVDPK